MQNASKAYKNSMRSAIRNRGYIKATIGVINSEAQRNVAVKDDCELTYFSNRTKPFNNYTVDNVYATGEQGFSRVDGSMYFLPKENSGINFYNNGIVAENIGDTIYIWFKGLTGFDIKGLTINFGECYPTQFTIESDSEIKTYANDRQLFVTEDVFDGTSFFTITPLEMVNGQGKLRIYEFSCGIVNQFNNKQVMSYSGKEFVSSITETIPSNDVSLTVDNQNQYYNPDNPESALAYMETGQEVKVQFGYDVTGKGDIEWMPEQTAYLKSWSATDTQAKFTATDRFDYLTGTYKKGKYRENGINLYELAIDVLQDAGIEDEREYFIDPYLKNIMAYNPMPVVKHSEALQIIANAGRCALYEDRQSRIHMQSSFVPDMEASANEQAEYSHIEYLLKGTEKNDYAICSNDFSTTDGTLYFMPKGQNYLQTGYVSDSIYYASEESENWSEKTPVITITLEAAFVAYGLLINFRNNAPKEFQIKTYYQDELVSKITEENPDVEWSTNERFDLFDKMELIFTKGYPNSKLVIDNVLIGDVTDYHLARNELTKTPVSTRKNKTKSISVQRTLYKNGDEVKDIISEEIIISESGQQIEVSFAKASYDLSVQIEENQTITAEIVESSNYYSVIQFSGNIQGSTLIKYVVRGKEYKTEEQYLRKNYHENGEEITWKNPLISTTEQAKDLEEWLASYYMGDVDYQISWRGDPRTDANDLFYLQLKTGENALIRAYENSLSFNGTWSGTLKARKAVMAWQ